jgi:Fe-S oxidoreductase
MTEVRLAALEGDEAKQLVEVPRRPPPRDWMSAPVEFRKGTWLHAAKPKTVEALGLPNPRQWSPVDSDWKLPDDFRERIHSGLRDRLERFRSLKIFMDCCVRCGACSDKCHFFLGGGDARNMPVLRAELLRSVYRNDFTLAGKLLGRLAGARPVTEAVIKEWFYFFFQCTECRRCSVFCPFGIDTAEITILVRELLGLLGLNVHWILDSVANSVRTGNHLGIQPHGLKRTLNLFADDIEQATGVRVDVPINKKGADILFVTPSGDFYAEPGTFTCMGYMILFHELGLNYTFSTYASDGGNFGLFTSHDQMRDLNAKIYAEAKRLGVKWILGGECGHMWRVVHQYMDTLNGPADFLDVPRSPVTGTVFEHARSTKMIHVMEFTADLIRHGKLKLDPARNRGLHVTFHDSCNPARAMGMLEEPRYVLKNVCEQFHEMPSNTIREQTFCCGGGAGLGADENMETRLRGGLPRGNAVRHVQQRYGVNRLAAMCAIDRATLQPVCEFWAPGVTVTGVHELVGNAMVLSGERARTLNLRLEPIEEQGKG